MAALTATAIGGKRPSGRFFEQTYSVAISNSAAADEYVVTNLKQIFAVVGHAVQGTTDRGVNFVLNAQGTGQTAGSTLGSLGIEATGAATVHFTVLGR